MTWFAWQGYNGGKAVDIAGSQEKQAVVLGFHGYGTEQQAEASPNSVAGFPNPLAFVQKEFVNAIIADYGYAKKAGEQPGGPNATPTPGHVVAGTVQAATSGWVHNVEQWLIRGFEMLLGIGLIVVSLAKLASDTPVGRAAAKAGKAAMIL